MPFQRPDMTSQTGTAYKAPIDADLAALAGITGKRRNINGDGRINQLSAAVAANTTWKYICDGWEAEFSGSGASGNFSAVATAFPSATGIGSTAFSTTGAVNVSFRTKMASEAILDLISDAPFLYPVATPAHSFASVRALAYQNTGFDVTVTPILRSADALDTFTTMTNSHSAAAITVPTGQVTQLVWDGAGLAFQLDNLTNAANGLCLQLDVAAPASVSSKNLFIGDVQFEGGQVSSYYGRTHLSEERRRCQRQYVEFMSGVVSEQLALIQNLTTTTGAGALRTPEPMAKTPVLVLSAASHFSQSNVSGGAVACSGLTIANATPRGAQLQTTVASGLIAGNASQLFGNSTSARLALDARL